MRLPAGFFSGIKSVVLAIAVGGVTACASIAPPSLRDGDIAILNGLIVDGTGSPARRGDILIRDDRLLSVGPRVSRSRLSGLRVLDAAGLIVSPGFIDLHAHGNPLVDDSLDNFLMQGATTVLLGQDGVSPQDERVEYDRPGLDVSWRAAHATGGDGAGRPVTLDQWMSAVDARGVSVNVATLSGHGTMRLIAGVGNAPLASGEQQSLMFEVLRADLAAGAFGLSSGLEYEPGRYAASAELIELARLVGEAGALVVSHMRTEDAGAIGGAIDELIAQGQFARVHISHLKVVFGQRAQEAQGVLDQIRHARARGIRISADAYPYTAGFADMSLLYPPWALSPEAWAQAVATRRAELETYLEARVARRNGPEAILIATGPYAGKTLAQVMSERGRTASQVLIDVFGHGGPLAAHRITEAAVNDAFIDAPEVAIGTDGGPWIRHPRSWGSYPRVLRARVRETGALSLESAIHKMSGLPADILGLARRGRLRAGAFADVVIFDPAAITDRATFETPSAPPEGIRWILLNGAVAVENGVRAEHPHGRLLRRGDDD